MHIRLQKFKGNNLNRPGKGPFQMVHRDRYSVIVQTQTDVQSIRLKDDTPSPVPGESQQVPAKFVLPSMAATRSAPLVPGGIAYQVEAVIGHADPDDPDGFFVLVRWERYEILTSNPPERCHEQSSKSTCNGTSSCRGNSPQDNFSTGADSRNRARGNHVARIQIRPRLDHVAVLHMRPRVSHVACLSADHVSTTCRAYKWNHVATTWPAYRLEQERGTRPTDASTSRGHRQLGGRRIPSAIAPS